MAEKITLKYPDVPDIDLNAVFKGESTELDFVFQGLLANTVGALIAPGASGKSMYALQALMSIACSVAGGDILNLKPKYHGQVTLLSAEDPLSILTDRLRSIGSHLSTAAREEVTENMHVKCCTGFLIDITTTEGMAWLKRMSEGQRLVVLDTISRYHRLDENNNGQMAWLIQILEHVCTATGATILFLHHVSKYSAWEGSCDKQQAARGASALVDNSRWAGYIRKMTPRETEHYIDPDFGRIGVDANWRYVQYGVSKCNYDVAPAPRWFRRENGGVLIPVDLIKVSKKKAAKAIVAREGGDNERW